MITISLTEKQVQLLKMSINHCLESCKEGGSKEGCRDCAELEEVLKKLP